MSFDKRRALQNALLYTQQGKWDRAIAEYQAIRKAEPADLSVCNNLGDLFARAGRPAEAIEQYRTLGESYRTDGLSVKAIAVYKKIAKLDPAWTDAYLACGELYLEQGLVGEAKLQFATAAQLFAKAGETGKVVEIYQRLVQLDPTNLSLLTKLADLLARQGAPGAAAEYERAARLAEAAGQLPEAQRLLRKARELAPPAAPDPEAVRALLAEGRTAQAAEMAEALAAASPDSPAAWVLLAEAQAPARPDRALQALREGLARGVAEAEVGDLLLRLLLEGGQTAEAEAVCGRLVEAALAQGEPDEAVERCGAVLRAAPSLLGVHRRRLELCEVLGREAEAAEAARALAEASEAAGDIPGAIEAYGAVLRHAPGDAAAAGRLALLAPEPAPAPAEAERDLAGFELLLEEEAPGEPAGAEEQRAEAELLAPLQLSELEEAPLPAEGEAPEPLPMLRLEEEERPVAGTESPLPEPDLAPESAGVPDPAPTAEPPAAEEPRAAPAVEPGPEFSLAREGSLDFLGGSIGLGALALEADDLPSGRAAEQLAEAEVYLKYGLEEKARERLVEVVRLSPNSVTVRRKLKHLYREQGQVGEACEQIAAIAEILQERQRHDAARDEIQEGLSLQPDHPALQRLARGMPAAPAGEGVLPVPPAEAVEHLQLEPEAQPVAEPAPAEPAPAEPAAGLPPDLPGLQGEAAAPDLPPPVLAELPEVPEPPAAPLPEEQELPPELRALLGQAEDAGLVVEGMDEDAASVLADDLAEAEFYLSQGMEAEARGVCRRLQAEHRDHPAVLDLAIRLAGGAAADSRAAPEPAAAVPAEAFAAPTSLPEVAVEPAPQREPEDAPPVTVEDSPEAATDGVALGAEPSAEPAEAPAVVGGEAGEAALVNGLLGELARGVGEQVDAKDFETHYNLGIAYKEMDLFDEAIQEFQRAQADPRRALECVDLLAQCLLAKGQPEPAAAALRAGLALPDQPPEHSRSLRYTLGLACEALGDAAGAAEQFAALEREAPGFRDAAARLAALRTRGKAEAGPPAPRRRQRKISFI